MEINLRFGRFALAVLLGVFLTACGGGGSGGGVGGSETTGSTLTGHVATYTATLDITKKTLFAQIRDFIFSPAHAQVTGVEVLVGDQSTTTDADGNFTLNDIPTGDQTVTFTQGSSSATYSLEDVVAGGTYTLNDIEVDGDGVSTEHTGVWSGPIDLGDGEYTMTMTIAANGNALTGELVVEGVDEAGHFDGTENGSSLVNTTYSVTSLDGCVLGGPITGTFSGDTLEGNAPITSDTCGLGPGDENPDSHHFTLTKTES